MFIVHTILMVRVAQESSPHLSFAYVVQSASCYTNRQHISLLVECYALMASGRGKAGYVCV